MSRFDSRAFLVNLIEGDATYSLGLLDEGVEWVVPGDAQFGGGLHRGRDEVLSFFTRVQELFPAGLRVDAIREWPSRNGSVVEATLSGATASGRPYENRYAFVIEVRAGKVIAVREYADTGHAESILGEERSAESRPAGRP